MNIEHLFNRTVTTYRLVESKDSTFSPVSTLYKYLETISCRIQKKKGFEPVEGGRKYSKISHIMYCNITTDINMKDVILYNGNTYTVVDSKKEGNAGAYLKVTLEKADVNLCPYLLGDQWISEASPIYSMRSIPSLLSYDDKLYAGTSYNGAGGGLLLRWEEGDTEWTELAPQLNLKSIAALEQIDGVIYGAANQTGALLYSWEEGDTEWTLEVSSPHITAVLSDLLAVDGVLYIGNGNGGFLDKWEPGDANMTALTNASDTSVNGLTHLNGKIYAGTSAGRLLSYNIELGGDWVEEAPLFNNQTQIWDLSVMDGVLYGSTGGAFGQDCGSLLKWEEGDSEWTQVLGPYGVSADIYSIIIICGKIYGSNDSGELLKWEEGDTAWTKVANQKESQERVLDLILHGDSLYGGTYKSFGGGHLFRWGIG